MEALLFATEQVLTIAQIQKATGLEGAKNIRAFIAELNEFYEAHDRAFRIHSIAGGFQLRTEEKYKSWIKKAKTVKTIQLSMAVLETLSIIAYKQPVTRSDIESIRTVDASYSLRSLLDKNLIRISGKAELPGRPLLYSTSRYFLEVFGLKNLDDLPQPEDFDIAKPDGNID